MKMRKADKANELTWCVLAGSDVRGWFETEAEALADAANSDEVCPMVLQLKHIKAD